MNRPRLAGRRYLCRLGRHRVSSYVVMVYAGCLSGIVVATSVVGVPGISDERLALVMVLLVVPALTGARLLYVAEHLKQFRAQPHTVWRRSDGGLAIYGGLGLTLIASIPVLAVAGIPYWPFWDAGVIAMLVGVVFGRTGCHMHGCCAGRPTSGPLGVRLPNAEGQWERRVPTPLIEAGWATIVVAGGIAVRDRLPFPGSLFAVAVGAYAAGRILLESTREGDTGNAAGKPVNLAVSAALLVATGCLLAAGLVF